MKMTSDIVIAWTDLAVSVNSFMGKSNGKIILNNISGSFGQNSINALMGSSGSGKTSLLKCLNGSQKYCLSSDSKIWVKNDLKIRKCFINQNQDQRVMSGLTVGQALSYSSKLKNSGESGVEVDHKNNVWDVMQELLITDIRDNLIENCSGGEIKRICIGLELTSVRKPNLLFIDEPTTGLDSNAAEVVCIVLIDHGYIILFIY